MARKRAQRPVAEATPAPPKTPPFSTQVTQLFLEEHFGYQGIRDSDPFGTYVLQSRTGEAAFIQRYRFATTPLENLRTKEALDATLLRFLLTIAAHGHRLLRVGPSQVTSIMCRTHDGPTFFAPNTPMDGMHPPTDWIPHPCLPSNTILRVAKAFPEDFGCFYATEADALNHRGYGAAVWNPGIIYALNVGPVHFPHEETIAPVSL